MLLRFAHLLLNVKCGSKLRLILLLLQDERGSELVELMCECRFFYLSIFFYVDLFQPFAAQCGDNLRRMLLLQDERGGGVGWVNVWSSMSPPLHFFYVDLFHPLIAQHKMRQQPWMAQLLVTLLLNAKCGNNLQLEDVHRQNNMLLSMCIMLTPCVLFYVMSFATGKQNIGKQ